MNTVEADDSLLLCTFEIFPDKKFTKIKMPGPTTDPVKEGTTHSLTYTSGNQFGIYG